MLGKHLLDVLSEVVSQGNKSMGVVKKVWD